jgi:phosphopantothenoylcysteine decarboxylase/phosphopantothenate--cysteine ligase
MSTDSLINKNILLGVTGSIAAYKAAELVRLLRGAGASVRVVLTRGGAQFVTPLTFQALSGEPVYSELMDADAEAAMGHIQLARWADALVIAPASADCLARLVQGRADDLLGAVCLAADAPLAIAPAMNQGMWRDAATQSNLAQLRERGVQVFGPAEGDQACGDIGPGRMLEPPMILELTASLFARGSLAGLSVLITAGPTHEALDPVRYLGNHSSGKMGFAIAQAAAEAGARVTLISGPVTLSTPQHVERIDVRSARDMHAAVLERAAHVDMFIAAAAVADYRPADAAPEKIKKNTEELTLKLSRNPDCLADVCALPNKPFTVGFAAETHELETHARKKLDDKGCDLIAANQVGGERGGFGSDENALLLVWKDGREELAMMRKDKLARLLIERVAQHYHRQLK